MRESCMDCVRKHLGEAEGYFDEAEDYPHHLWLGVGQLRHAASEARKVAPEFARRIRKTARAIVRYRDDRAGETIDALIIEATRIAGEEVEYSEDNNKKFEAVEADRFVRSVVQKVQVGV